MQFVDNLGPDQGLRCPLIEVMYAVVYVKKQRMSRSDWTDAHAHFDLCIRAFLPGCASYDVGTH